MKVIIYPQKYKFKSPTIVLGGFESFHSGHMSLIKKSDKEQGETLLMMIKDPMSFSRNKTSTILPLDVRLQQAANIGIDGVVLLDSNKFKYQNQSGDKFIDTIVKSYNIKKIICGKDFKYGHLAKSDAEDLKKQFSNTEVVDIKKVNQNKIGSSIIKELIYYGNIEAANKLLVYDWTTSGIIDHEWEYKTDANILKTSPGIYYVSVEYENLLYPSIMHTNLNKISKIFLTTKNNKLLGRKVRVHWHKKIRTIIKNSNDSVAVKDTNELKKILREQ